MIKQLLHKPLVKEMSIAAGFLAFAYAVMNIISLAFYYHI